MINHRHIPSLSRIAEPESEPLTLAEVKTYLKIGNSNDDALITSIISTVRVAAEDFLRSSLITQSWRLSYDKYAPACIFMPMGPVQSITSVKAIARDGAETTISPNSYYLSSGNRKLVFEACPISHRIEVVYVAGYGDDESGVPSPIRYGMLAHISAIYDGRAGGHSLPQQAVDFYMPYRGVRV